MGKGMFKDVVRRKPEANEPSPSIAPRGPLEKNTYELSDDLMFEVCSLVHRRWAETFDTLKMCRNEKPDGTSDWRELHDERLRRAIDCESKWKRRLDEAAAIFGSILRAE